MESSCSSYRERARRREEGEEKSAIIDIEGSKYEGEVTS